MQTELLYKLGFSDKSAKVYLSLLQLGPSSVRNIAEKSGLNRGSAYEALKWLQEEGVIAYYKKDSKHHFVAENPEKLHELVRRRNQELARVDSDLLKVVPELQALHDKGGERPVARYFGQSDLKDILEDVLVTCEQSEEKSYLVYSTEGIREYLYKDFPTFSDVRIAKGIMVKVIAIGGGGELRGFDQRKWFDVHRTSAPGLYNAVPTYIIMYPGKTAYISLNTKGEPIGVVIENEGVAGTQRLIFDEIWRRL